MSAAEDPATRHVIAVKQAHEDELLAKANVLGVGVGLRQRGGERGGEIAVIVLVSRKFPAAQLAPRDRIPSEIDGVPVDVQEVGELRAGE